MKVTKEEMALLETILDVGHSYQGESLCNPYGEAIELMIRWRNRGVTSSEFELLPEAVQQVNGHQNFKRYPTLDGSSPLPPQSPSSSSPPSSHPPKALFFSQAKKKKSKLDVRSVIEAVPPDLTLQSLSFRSAWKRWVENRLALGKVTIGAFQLHMAKCAAMGERRAIAAIEHSIASSYQTIYEPKTNHNASRNGKAGTCL